jgi:hypothetical protein
VYNIDILDKISRIIQVLLMWAWSRQTHKAGRPNRLTTTSNTGFTPPASQATRIRPSCSKEALMTCAVVVLRLNEMIADDLGKRVATFSLFFLDGFVAA